MFRYVVAALLAGLAVPASAQTVFSFTYSYTIRPANTFTVSGLFVGTQIIGTNNYLITDASGVRNSLTSESGPFTITGIAPVGSINGNDNVLTFFAPRDASAPSYYIPTANGIAFTETGGAPVVDLFSSAANQRTQMGQEMIGSATTPAAGFLLTIAPVPESATWAMFIAGFGLVGAAMRSRRANVRFA